MTRFRKMEVKVLQHSDDKIDVGKEARSAKNMQKKHVGLVCCAITPLCSLSFKICVKLVQIVSSFELNSPIIFCPLYDHTFLTCMTTTF
jgi:hypothetical protein